MVSLSLRELIDDLERMLSVDIIEVVESSRLSEGVGVDKVSDVEMSLESVAAAEIGVAVAELGVAVAELGVAVAELGVAVAKLGVAVAELGVAMAELGVAVAELGVAVAELGVAAAEVGVVALGTAAASRPAEVEAIGVDVFGCSRGFFSIIGDSGNTLSEPGEASFEICLL